VRGDSDTPRPDGKAQSDEVRRVTWVGLYANLALSALKFAGGVLGNSQAVIADAVHSLSDMASDVAILVGVKYWDKPADRTHPHGHRRVETMVTLGIGVLLAVVATGLLRNAVVTLRVGPGTPPGWIAFWAALVSVATKELLYRWTVVRGRQVKSMALVANAWHHRSDAFSSLPAALAVAAAAIDPDWTFLDPVAAVAVSLFIYQVAFKIVRPAFEKLIDSGAPEEDLQRIRATALETDGVRSLHAVRTRYISGSSLAVDLHIQVDEDMTVREGHDVSAAVKRRLIVDGPDVVDVVVHLEPYARRPEGQDDAPQTTTGEKDERSDTDRV